MIEVGNFTLTPGNSSLVLPLSIPDDDYVENDKQFRLLVSQPGSVHPPLIISFTIIDNDRMWIPPCIHHTVYYIPLVMWLTLLRRCDSGVCE